MSDVASDCLNSALETLSKTKIATKTNKEDKDKSKVHCTSVRTNFGLVLLGFHTLSLIFFIAMTGNKALLNGTFYRNIDLICTDQNEKGWSLWELEVRAKR